jgi:hypothetical protein
MVLTAEQIKGNYDVLLGGIEKYVTGDRKQQFLDFYNSLDERIALLPASHKKAYHNCFPGGYVEHVIRVITAAFKLMLYGRKWEQKIRTQMKSYLSPL